MALQGTFPIKSTVKEVRSKKQNVDPRQKVNQVTLHLVFAARYAQYSHQKVWFSLFTEGAPLCELSVTHKSLLTEDTETI